MVTALNKVKLATSGAIHSHGVVPSDHIEGRFLNIIARNSVKQNIDKCFKQAGIEIADYIISPLALANAVLTNSEKRSAECI